jgi:hypothetical protein
MLKRVAIPICAALMSVPAAYATQTTQPQAAAQPKKSATTEPSKPTEEKSQSTPVKSPEPPPLAVNVKIEVSITDQSGNNPPAKKTVSMVVGDRQRNSIRSSASVPVKSVAFTKPPGATESTPANILTPSVSYRNVTINVDAHPSIVQKEPNKLMLELVIQYQPKSGGGQEDLEPGMASLNESMSLILESGKPTVVSQAADPTSDRKITVDVTATILK